MFFVIFVVVFVGIIVSEIPGEVSIKILSQLNTYMQDIIGGRECLGLSICFFKEM
jgi:hypothetical protein